MNLRYNKDRLELKNDVNVCAESRVSSYCSEVVSKYMYNDNYTQRQ